MRSESADACSRVLGCIRFTALGFFQALCEYDGSTEVRRITVLGTTLLIGGIFLGCHYHDYRDYLYDGDLSRDTHGMTIYQTNADKASLEEPIIVEPGEAY